MAKKVRVEPSPISPTPEILTKTEAPKEANCAKSPSEGQKKSQKGVGLPSMIFTLLGTRLGTGIVGVPYATLQVGFLFALVFQVLYIPLSVFSIWLLLQAKSLTGKNSISELGIY